jgi:hypothetical protein
MTDTQQKEGKQPLDILLKEYETVRVDIQQTIGRAKAHVRHFQIVLGAVVALFTVVIRKDTEIASNMLFWLFVMYSITTIVAYLVFDMVEIQYGIEIGGARCGVLEEMINKRLKEALLVWETELAAKLFDPGEQIKGGILHPSFFLTFFQIVLIAMAVFSVPAYFYHTFWAEAGGTERKLVVTNLIYSGAVIIFFFSSLLSVLFFAKQRTRSRFITAVKDVNEHTFGITEPPIREPKRSESVKEQSA